MPDLGQPSYLRGILLTMSAVFIFALQDGITRILMRDYEPGQFLLIRQTVFLLFTLCLIKFRGRSVRLALRAKRPVLQSFRSLTWVLDIIAFAFAVRYLELADAHAIVMIFPILASLLAIPLLGESIGWRRGIAIIGGFAGTLIILRPGLGIFDVGAVWALAAALLLALYSVLTSLASRTDHFETSLLYMAIISFLISVAWGVTVWKTPDTQGWILMLTLSITGLTGHVLLIKSLECAPAVVLQPFNYTQLAWGIIIGYLMFGDMPDGWTLVGGAIVVGSGLYMLAREHLSKKRGSKQRRAT
ncbi:MAG: DMT family transporter [Gammaproteobacteria bacterium]|nr:DMT family transporter [Gammaproteobacteria bacterium]